jgi:hypothetical protein
MSLIVHLTGLHIAYDPARKSVLFEKLGRAPSVSRNRLRTSEEIAPFAPQ